MPDLPPVFIQSLQHSHPTCGGAVFDTAGFRSITAAGVRQQQQLPPQECSDLTVRQSAL
jgi:hypothetical protein